METIVDLSTRIKQLILEVEQQTVAVSELAVSFADGAQRQVRSDQAILLRSLKSRIMGEVQNIKRSESASQSSANTRALLSSGTAFIFGSLFMAEMGRKDALDIGSRMAELRLTKNIPFGLVLIAIGKEGLPEDLKIIPLSLWARDSNRKESEVEDSLKSNGYLLMTPEQFAELLDKVASEILDGSVSLPMAVDEVIKRIV